MSIEFSDEPCSVAIKDGNVVRTWPGGPKVGVPLRVFREECRRATEALMDYDRDNVFPFAKPKRGKAGKDKD